MTTIDKRETIDTVDAIAISQSNSWGKVKDRFFISWYAAKTNPKTAKTIFVLIPGRA